MKILIVEDERVVAEDMRQRLKMMGYTILAIALSGEDALEKVKDNPDLVLMDIVLGGDIDGIEAAEYIRSHYNIPVVFVTAYTDEKMVERAKLTEPYGYIVKPFEDRELRATIEMALYKHKIEKDLQSERDKLQALMDGLTRTGIGINIVKSDYTILFQNESLKKEFGDVTGKSCYECYMGLKEPCSACPLVQTIQNGTVERAEVVGVAGRYYEVISAPLSSLNGRVDKAIEVIKDITEQKQIEMQLKKLFEASALINSTMDIETVFKFISDAYQELVGFDNFMIFLVSKDNTIYPAYASERIRDKVKGIVLPYGEGLVGYCIKTKETLLLGNAHKDARFKEIPGVTESFTSQIVSPLVIEDECVGAIHISKAEEDAYNKMHVEALKPLTTVISSAVRNSRLYQEIKEFGQKLEKRIEERSRKIEVLLNTREKLQRERNWEKGMQTIVESIRQLGVERCGIFLVNPMKKTLEFHFAKGANVPKSFPPMPLRDTEYFGVKCVQEKRTIYVKDYTATQGKQITSETQSFVWVPIVVQDEAFAAIAADNATSNTPMTEKDVKDLEILASMCAAFIDRTRLLVEPVAEQMLKTEIKHWLSPAEGYIIIEKRPKKSFEIVVDLITHGIPGFVISRIYPEKLKREYKLQKTPVVWLSRSERKDSINPTDLSKLCYIVEDFTRKSEESVILLDGIEYLITQAGFDSVLKCMQELKDSVTMNNSRLVIPLHKDVLSQKEYGLLEKEFKML